MKSILVPVDFSENSIEALRFAIQLAQDKGSNLFIFNNYFVPIPTSTPLNMMEDLKESYFQEAQKKLEDTTKKIFHQLLLPLNPERVHYLLDWDTSVVGSIIKAEQSNGIEMVVMGTEGASGLKKLFLGSNAAQIIERVKCPILAIPNSCNYQEIKKIAFASTLTETTQDLEKVINFAKFFNAQFDLFHVYPVFPEFTNVAIFDNEKFVSSLREYYDYEKINLYFIKTSGDNLISEGIENYVESYKPSILIMQTHKRDLFDKIFDPSITKKVAYSTKVPLLSVK